MLGGMGSLGGAVRTLGPGAPQSNSSISDISSISTPGELPFGDVGLAGFGADKGAGYRKMFDSYWRTEFGKSTLRFPADGVRAIKGGVDDAPRRADRWDVLLLLAARLLFASRERIVFARARSRPPVVLSRRG